MKKAAPPPILWLLDKPSSHRIPMNISEFFHPLGLAPYVEIVVAWLPKRTAFGKSQFARDILLQHLQRQRKLTAFRLTHQQMNVLGHHDIAEDVEVIPTSPCSSVRSKTSRARRVPNNGSR